MSVNVDQILGLGDDQIVSQYMLIFPDGIPGGGDTKNIALRCDTSFDMPEEAMNTYEIYHKGYKIPKTGMLQDTTKEFTIEVRVDQQWKVYNDLEKWKNLVYDEANGTGMPELTTNATIIVQAEDKSQKPVKQFIFKYAKPRAIKVNSFDHQSGDPLRISVTFIYGQKIEK